MKDKLKSIIVLTVVALICSILIYLVTYMVG